MNLQILRTPIASVLDCAFIDTPDSPILDYIRSRGTATIVDIRTEFGISDNAAKARIYQLRDKGRIARAGTLKRSCGGSPIILWRAAA